MVSTDKLVWRVPEGRCVCERFGEDTLVFNVLSGETHQLNELAATALEVLLNSAQDPDTLADQICTNFEVEDEAFLRTQMQQLINEFDELGLVESSLP